MTALATRLLEPGTLGWLLVHHARIGWRSATAMMGNTGRGTFIFAVLAGGLVMHAIAWPAAQWLSPHLHGPEASLAAIVVVLACVFSWMLAQSLFGAARTLYLRGDLDLLLGSPIPPRHVFATKAAGIAAGSFGSIALLTLPVANAGAILGNIAWLTLYPTLVALTLIATALGLSLTIALFRLLGPRRARMWTQLTGAATAGAFVLGVQIAAILPAPVRETIAQSAGVDANDSGSLWILARLPVEAVRGDTAAAALLLTIAVVLFVAATALLGRHFAAVSVASAGTLGGGEKAARARRRPRFRLGLTHNMRRKEWRLLVRDPGLFAQLSLQMIYTLPIAVVLLRNEHLPSIFALAPTIVVVAAQVSASLAWLTVSGEDAPELIATAPVTATAVGRAKLDAVAVPVLAILALPLAALSLISVDAALKTALVAAAAGTSTALLNFWHPMPGNRRGMLRRHSQSKMIALLEHGIATLWAIAIILTLIGSVLAAVPMVLVTGILISFKQRCAEAAEH